MLERKFLFSLDFNGSTVEGLLLFGGLRVTGASWTIMIVGGFPRVDSGESHTLQHCSCIAACEGSMACCTSWAI